jgi:hypothetical protein
MEIAKHLANKPNTWAQYRNSTFLWKVHVMYVVLFIQNEKCKVPFCPKLPDIRKSTPLLEGSKTSPLVFPIIVVLRWRWVGLLVE